MWEKEGRALLLIVSRLPISPVMGGTNAVLPKMSFTFNSIIKWDTAAPSKTQRKTHLSAFSPSRFSSRLWQRLWVTSDFVQLYLTSPNCTRTSGNATLRPCQHFHYKPSCFHGFVTFPEEEKTKGTAEGMKLDIKTSQLGSNFCMCVAIFQENQINPFWKWQKNS